MKTPVLKTESFILRLMAPNDAPAIVKHANSRRVSRFMGRLPYPYTLRDAKDWIKRVGLEERSKKRESFRFVIEKDGEAVGSIGLSKIQPGHKAILGYWLGEKYWGQGIVTEAVKVISVFAFKRLKLKKLSAEVFLPNIASRRVLEKNGFKIEGILRKEIAKNGRLHDVYLLSKVR